MLALPPYKVKVYLFIYGPVLARLQYTLKAINKSRTNWKQSNGYGVGYAIAETFQTVIIENIQ